MVKISIGIGEKGPLSVKARGHSGYAQKGEDVVCAAVSTLMHALLLGLKEVVDAKDVIFDIRDNVPLFFLSWSEGTLGDASAKAVIETVLCSLRSIADSYPGYVQIVEVSVN
ncbi:ribosomal-processing cysteine protease Prp [Acetomicrobium hydrogeniformans]|uniref:Ribosomal processing cysteine protease Prp n=1 Tax=Acetomicrobium hydrogeniformans TaxID=649746 RepID=A0A7V6ZFB1_9BACT|nr:ribosomal-processing cysteine protease Prp [Acetomicrobium hydrogeniformans]HHZ04914.1 ribosomal-processing cysteine protease Prp [Acetomicrobium hydrogeniformans]